MSPVINFNPSPSPAPYRTPQEDQPTLLVTYWCFICSVVVILFRCAGRLVRIGRLYRDDKLMLLTLLPMFARVACAHFVLKDGTNNVDVTKLRIGDGEVRRREIGSMMVLAARVFYTAYMWSQKFCITEFYVRLTSHLCERKYKIGLKAIRWSLLATFLGVVIAIFAECRPVYKYWQVIPDPGPSCRQGYVPLYTMGFLSIATDFLLVFCTMPAIILSGLHICKKLRLIGVFSLSLFCIGFASFRIRSVIAHNGSQPYRTLLASFDMLLATVVANATIINSFARHRGEKRNKFRFVRDMTESPVVAIRRHAAWGSDEELAADFACRPSSSADSASYYHDQPHLEKSPATISPTYSARHLTVPKRAMTFAEPPVCRSPSELLKRTNSDITLIQGGYRDIPRSPRDPKLRDVGGLLKAERARRKPDAERHHRRSRSMPASDAGAIANLELMDVGGLFALRERESHEENRKEHSRSRRRVPADDDSESEQRDVNGFFKEEMEVARRRTALLPPPRQSEVDDIVLCDQGGLLESRPLEPVQERRKLHRESTAPAAL